MRVGTIDVRKLRGISDKGLGYGKEFVGVLVGNDHLESEGAAQQERASTELKSLRNEIRAQKDATKARLAERRQRAEQRAKKS